MFVKTDTILDKILAQKQIELQTAYSTAGLTAQIEQAAYQAPRARGFKTALDPEAIDRM